MKVMAVAVAVAAAGAWAMSYLPVLLSCEQQKMPGVQRQRPFRFFESIHPDRHTFFVRCQDVRWNGGRSFLSDADVLAVPEM